jgi:hypothetical protein
LVCSVFPLKLLCNCSTLLTCGSMHDKSLPSMHNALHARLRLTPHTGSVQP